MCPLPSSGMKMRRFCSTKGESNTLPKGVSVMVFRAYWLSAGLELKLSIWLTPPARNNQSTLFARGAKCGSPFCSVQRSPHSAAQPSRCSMAANAKPGNPVPRFVSSVRRVNEECGRRREEGTQLILLSNLILMS